MFVELAVSPLAVAVLASAGLGTCDDGFGGYWGFEVAAVLLLNGLDFQNARLLLPPDWQPARPVSAIAAHTKRARRIPIKRFLWKTRHREGRKERPCDLLVEVE